MGRLQKGARLLVEVGIGPGDDDLVVPVIVVEQIGNGGPTELGNPIDDLVEAARFGFVPEGVDLCDQLGMTEELAVYEAAGKLGGE